MKLPTRTILQTTVIIQDLADLNARIVKCLNEGTANAITQSHAFRLHQ